MLPCAMTLHYDRVRSIDIKQTGCTNRALTLGGLMRGRALFAASDCALKVLRGVQWQRLATRRDMVRTYVLALPALVLCQELWPLLPSTRALYLLLAALLCFLRIGPSSQASL